MAHDLGFSAFAQALLSRRGADGGFPPRSGLPAEPEPTALAAIALDDASARTWLEAHQRSDGQVGMDLGHVVNDSATALSAIALAGAARERALDAVVATRAAAFPSTPAVPLDDRYQGWSWTLDSSGWTEPTARAVLALRLLRPAAQDAIDDGIGFLRDRECVGGGWNYGNRIVLDVALPPFGQTTAVALLALRGSADAPLLSRGIGRLKELWRQESSGGLSLALATAALRASRDPDYLVAVRRLEEDFARTGFLGDVVALAWATIATGPALGSLEVPS